MRYTIKDVDWETTGSEVMGSGFKETEPPRHTGTTRSSKDEADSGAITSDTAILGRVQQEYFTVSPFSPSHVTCCNSNAQKKVTPVKYHVIETYTLLA